MRHKLCLQTRLGPVMTVANLVSFARVTMVPWALSASTSGKPVAALILAVCICGSDLVDGAIARATNTASRLGAIIDVVADGIVVFAIQCALTRAGQWPPYLLAASIGAFATFIAGSFVRRAVVRAPFGRYLGAVIMALLLIKALVQVFAPGLWSAGLHVLCFPVAVYALAATAENLVRIHAGVRRRGKPATSGHDHGWVHPPGVTDAFRN